MKTIRLSSQFKTLCLSYKFLHNLLRKSNENSFTAYITDKMYQEVSKLKNEYKIDSHSNYFLNLCINYINEMKEKQIKLEFGNISEFIRIAYNYFHIPTKTELINEKIDMLKTIELIFHDKIPKSRHMITQTSLDKINDLHKQYCILINDLKELIKK